MTSAFILGYIYAISSSIYLYIIIIILLISYDLILCTFFYYQDFQEHLRSLNSPLDIPVDVNIPSPQTQPARSSNTPRLRLFDLPSRTPQTTGSEQATPSPADVDPSSQSQPPLSSIPKRVRLMPAEGYTNQWTVRRQAAENSLQRRREAQDPAAGGNSSDDMFPASPVERPSRFGLRSLRPPTMPTDMDVSDNDDPQPLPSSPSTQNTGRFRFRSLVGPMSGTDSGTDSEYQPPADAQSNTSGSDTPPAAAGRSPSIPPPCPNRGRSGRGPGRPSLRGRRRGRGRGAQIVPEPDQPDQLVPAAPTNVPVLAPEAPPGPRRQRPRGPRDPSVLVSKSYKRARGPMREAGDPIRVLQNQTIVGSDKVTIWHSAKVQDSPDIVEIEHPIPMGHPAQHVKDLSPEDLFSSFLPDNVIQDDIVNHTNRKIAELNVSIGQNNIDKASYKDTDLNEIKAVLGVLFLSGVLRDNTLSTSTMFSPLFGTPFYRCVFSQRRFDFLLRCMRFDEYATRHQRKADRFFLIRVLWDHVIEKCKENWVAGPIVTVDEQLIGFRGKVLFRMYLPDKPNKYGIKIFVAADGESHYVGWSSLSR